MIRLTSWAGPGVLGKPYLNVLHDSAYFWISPGGFGKLQTSVLSDSAYFLGWSGCAG